MEIDVIKNEKDEFEARVNNVTTAEILRVYLNKENVDFAAWRREHPTKPVVMKITSKNIKKDVGSAIAAIKKDLDTLLKSIKK